MNAPLYTPDILRLAASLPEQRPLERVDGVAEERSPTCGSRIRIEVQMTGDGRVQNLRQAVHACAFGQASATLLARGAVGRAPSEIEAALAALAAWLSNKSDRPGDWPGLEALAPARNRTARHGAILLPFRALAAAMKGAKD